MWCLLRLGASETPVCQVMGDQYCSRLGQLMGILMEADSRKAACPGPGPVRLGPSGPDLFQSQLVSLGGTWLTLNLCTGDRLQLWPVTCGSSGEVRVVPNRAEASRAVLCRAPPGRAARHTVCWVTVMRRIGSEMQGCLAEIRLTGAGNDSSTARTGGLPRTTQEETQRETGLISVRS